jgi:hypothetical protein
MHDVSFTRRDGLKAASFGSVESAQAMGSTSSGAHTSSGREPSFVAYFSRTGNTRVVANQIRKAMTADIVEIEPLTPYPEDYRETVEQASRETQARSSPH